jgi:hypothetical protein
MTNDPKFEDLNPAITNIGRKYKRSLMFLLASCDNSVVDQLNKDPKFEGLNLAIADIGRK